MRGKLLTVALSSAALLGVGAGAPAKPTFALELAQEGSAVRSWQHARPSLCNVTPGADAYPWPIKPFRKQHPVRAYFGDPRTLFHAESPDVGSFSFHNGIDIVATAGTLVYPVASGVVTRVKPDEIIVSSDQGARTFQYWHLAPLVHMGVHVYASRTPLGTIRPEREHVHLTELDGKEVVNPLQPGHLTPYWDNTPPTVEHVYIRDRSGEPVDPLDVSGTVALAAAATDTPLGSIPPPWTGVPVTPARVAWELTTATGQHLLPAQVTADFSHTIPATNEFWSVYDEGTYQNFPTVGQRYFYGTPGEYLFNLTPSLLDTRHIPPGTYTLTVSASDTCGNEGSLSERIRVLPHPAAAELTNATLASFARPPAGRWPRRFWTVVLAKAPEPQALLRARGLAADARELDRIGLATAERWYRHPRREASLVIAGAFATWADAYTAAQRIAAEFPNAVPNHISLHWRRAPVLRRPLPGRITLL